MTTSVSNGYQGTGIIYESPDKGQTVYTKPIGSDQLSLVKQMNESNQRQADATRANRFLKILKLAKEDVVLADIINALETTYILKYGPDDD